MWNKVLTSSRSSTKYTYSYILLSLSSQAANKQEQLNWIGAYLESSTTIDNRWK